MLKFIVNFDFRFVLAGMAVTPVAIVIAIANSGFGHGSDWVGRTIFPWSSLLPGTYSDASTLNFLATLLQFPVYGLIVGYGGKRSAGLMLVVHAFAVVIERHI